MPPLAMAPTERSMGGKQCQGVCVACGLSARAWMVGVRKRSRLQSDAHRAQTARNMT